MDRFLRPPINIQMNLLFSRLIIECYFRISAFGLRPRRLGAAFSAWAASEESSGFAGVPIEPLLVGGHAPFSPEVEQDKSYHIEMDYKPHAKDGIYDVFGEKIIIVW